MLALTRRKNDRVKLYCRGVEITVVMLSAKPGQAKLGFEAPDEVKVLRDELALHAAHEASGTDAEESVGDGQGKDAI